MTTPAVIGQDDSELIVNGGRPTEQSGVVAQLIWSQLSSERSVHQQVVSDLERQLADANRVRLPSFIYTSGPIYKISYDSLTINRKIFCKLGPRTVSNDGKKYCSSYTNTFSNTNTGKKFSAFLVGKIWSQ